MADTLARGENAFSTFMDLLRTGIASAVRDVVRGRADPEQSRLVALRPLDAWGDVWHALTRLQDETERFALDKRQAIVAGARDAQRKYVMTRRYYITTPIYYVNGAPHLGHAYTSIAADVMARFKRLDGFDVFFLTGTDEHGQKVEQAARRAGLDPQSYVDHVSADFRDMSPKMGVSFDDWIRTTEQRHKVSCAELWRRIEASGDIYLGHYEGWYAVRDEAFYDEERTDRRGRTAARWRRRGAPVEWVREPSYFFRLSAWQDRLLKFYEEQPGFHRAARPPQRGHQLRARRAAGSVDQPDQLPLGHPGAGRARTM